MISTTTTTNRTNGTMGTDYYDDTTDIFYLYDFYYEEADTHKYYTDLSLKEITRLLNIEACQWILRDFPRVINFISAVLIERLMNKADRRKKFMKTGQKVWQIVCAIVLIMIVIKIANLIF